MGRHAAADELAPRLAGRVGGVGAFDGGAQPGRLVEARVRDQLGRRRRRKEGEAKDGDR